MTDVATDLKERFDWAISEGRAKLHIYGIFREPTVQL
jgi:hypothetical protein